MLKMRYIVYVLRSLKDRKRYIGMTERPLSERISEHNSGLVKSTRHRKPLQYSYHEEFSSKKEAMKREKFFKSGKGREFLKSIGK